MKLTRTRIVVVLTLVLLVACSPLPQVQVWQPWTRVLGSIVTTDSVEIDVVYASEILPGSDDLLQAEIYSNIENLLSRRGFELSESKPSSLAMDVQIRTTRRDQIKTGYRSHITYNAGYYSGSGVSSTSTGVLIASLVNALAIQKKETVLAHINTTETYTHILGIEIVNTKDDLLWKGESTWDSDSPDVRDQIITAIQILFSSLPTDANESPYVPAIEDGKSANFLEVKCIDNWFSCPSLPYRISFTGPVTANSGTRVSRAKTSLRSIKDEIALYAYYDLIQTAEYALPLGSARTRKIEEKYDKPLDKIDLPPIM